MKTSHALLVLFAFSLIQCVAAEDSRVYELRVYHANEGELDALHARFRDHTVKLFEKHGMENIGYWVPENNAGNTLVYLLAYPSREARDTSWKAFMTDPDWTAAYKKSTAQGRLVNKVDATFLEATDYSSQIKAAKADAPRYFELRTYTTNDGKLDDLDSRFRDHTLAIFKRQGMQNLAYWHLMEDQKGSGHTLVYLLGYADKESKGKAWEGFGRDPQWRKAYRESIANGKLVNKVESVNLVPTDYSPTR